MQLTASDLLPIFLAGIMNGSFVIPAKYINNFVTEKIWFIHSILGLAIIPWLILILTAPEIIHNYFSLEATVVTFLIFGGIIFGIGQVCFAYAIETIGVALSFTINLGIGVTIGSMFLVFYKASVFTSKSYFVTLAVLLIVCSLIIYYFSSKNNSDINSHRKHYQTSWLLASLAGFASGFQNIVFVIVAFHTKTQFQVNNSFWVWPPFLLAAAIPMAIGFGYRMKQNHRNIQTDIFSDIKNIVLITIMGLFFTGSLALYSNGMSKLSNIHQIIGWPTLMIMIILTSQAWGWLYRESRNITPKNKFYRLLSMLLLIVSIVILAIEV